MIQKSIYLLQKVDTVIKNHFDEELLLFVADNHCDNEQAPNATDGIKFTAPLPPENTYL